MILFHSLIGDVLMLPMQSTFKQELPVLDNGSFGLLAQLQLYSVFTSMLGLIGLL